MGDGIAGGGVIHLAPVIPVQRRQADPVSVSRAGGKAFRRTGRIHMIAQELLYLAVPARMPPRAGLHHIAQGRRAKGIGIGPIAGHPHAPRIAGMGFKHGRLAGAKLRCPHRMKTMVSLERPRVAGATARSAIKQRHALLRIGVQRG